MMGSLWCMLIVDQFHQCLYEVRFINIAALGWRTISLLTGPWLIAALLIRTLILVKSILFGSVLLSILPDPDFDFGSYCQLDPIDWLERLL